jgi:ribonuclease T1
MDSNRIRAALAAAVVAGVVAAGIAIPGGGDSSPGTPEALPTTATTEETSTRGTPAAEESIEIARVLRAIEAGDPLPYEEDGGVFQNREGLLPDEPLGYYREYTVETSGSTDRGARRLVIGEAGETYYTDDHYASFRQINPEEYP